MPPYSSFWILFGSWPKWRVALLGSICVCQEQLYRTAFEVVEHSLYRCAWRVWLPGESWESPPTASLGSSFPKVVFRLTSICRGDILPTKSLFFLHSCGEGGEEEIGTGYIILAKMFWALQIKMFDKYSLIFIALLYCSLENVFPLVTCQWKILAFSWI